MTIKVYDKLPQAAKKIRQEVFGQEQGFKKEFDEIDPIAKHIILLEDDDPVATCRFYYSKERGMLYCWQDRCTQRSQRKTIWRESAAGSRGRN